MSLLSSLQALNISEESLRNFILRNSEPDPQVTLELDGLSLEMERDLRRFVHTRKWELRKVDHYIHFRKAIEPHLNVEYRRGLLDFAVHEEDLSKLPLIARFFSGTTQEAQELIFDREKRPFNFPWLALDVITRNAERFSTIVPGNKRIYILCISMQENYGQVAPETFEKTCAIFENLSDDFDALHDSAAVIMRLRGDLGSKKEVAQFVSAITDASVRNAVACIVSNLFMHSWNLKQIKEITCLMQELCVPDRKITLAAAEAVHACLASTYDYSGISRDGFSSLLLKIKPIAQNIRDMSDENSRAKAIQELYDKEPHELGLE